MIVKANVKINNVLKVSSEVKVASGVTGTPYDGDYEVTPRATQQVLSTKDKFLKQDVIVNEIPYIETSNPQNGTTVTIG